MPEKVTFIAFYKLQEPFLLSLSLIILPMAKKHPIVTNTIMMISGVVILRSPF